MRGEATAVIPPVSHATRPAQKEAHHQKQLFVATRPREDELSYATDPAFASHRAYHNTVIVC